ncbi:pyridoxal-dependent decarboxylase, exosortase A system-associated [Sphingorhabdus lutea]|uniref:Pyridoxal-dependent decarboxylase, exosortase A system-associated n=1 Tax=Sphingorhabdus lutea TaxID=1913578 RepID=A0A1L3JBH2_9SPHN|nr:pyridoxal-dependent decarboxylase, exosortase A system-associated [Sphingorhabdus lutea]APG62449.1 pyridoxal-dependent decarboxylase, exosortase A system-associated [Sphingorhabdus lutea]
MKKLGPIPQGYAAQNGELIIAGQCVSEIAAAAGSTPLFIYSKDMLDGRIALLRQSMPQKLAVHYAMKANPFGPFLQHIYPMVDGIDIASGGELDIAIKNGVDPEKISFAGPGKRDEELSKAIKCGVTINLESENEMARAIAIGRQLNIIPNLAVRVNPSFDLKGSGMKMGGGAKQFGVDEERVPAMVRALIDQGANWRGFHIFSGSQALSADAIIDAQAQTINLAARLCNEIGVPAPKVNLGGGFGIAYFPGDMPLDVFAIGMALEEKLNNLPPILQNTHFCIELGRYISGEAGVYVTKIIDKKISHGEIFLITDGGLHHQLAASGNFGTVVRRNYPVAIANKFESTDQEVASVVGCLCTPLDRLADQALLPRAEIGDIVAVFCAGAYGATASPSAFLGQGHAQEILL